MSNGSTTISARAARRRAASALVVAALALSPRLSAPGPAEAAPRTSPKPRYTSLRLLDLFTVDGGPVVPGPPPRGLGGLAPEDCATCHAEIAAEWRSSAHARAFSDEIFQAEYRTSAERFCRNCHAPLLTDPRAADAAEKLARGIDCATCHVRGGHVLGSTGRGDADHAARRDARLATSAFCGSCHQFDFPAPEPGATVRYHPGQPLQNTLVEWRRSRYAGTSCQHCHMPRVAPADPRARPYRSHAFATLRDPAALAAAVRVSARARRRGPRVELTVTLRPGVIGHDFPTGDMFRQAHLELTVGTARQRAILQRAFAQTINADATGHLLGQVDDTRVRGAARAQPWREGFAFDDVPRDVRVATWKLTLYRLDPGTAVERKLAREAVEIPVAVGTIALP